MAPIRRARHYITYLAALLISGFFSLLGRPAPSWAEEARGEHSAKVFHETLGGPALAEERRSPRSQVLDEVGVSGRWLDAAQLIEITRLESLSPAARAAFGGKVEGVLQTIESKARTGQDLTFEEALIFQTVQDGALLNALSQRINDLITQVNVLTKLLKEKGKK